MYARKILFPTDFSRASDSALRYATSLAKDTGATLVIAHVSEPPLAYGGGELYYGIPEPDEGEQRRMLEAIRATDESVTVEHHLLRGDPAMAIVQYAKEANVDLIVMGTHGRKGLTRLLMGSVAEEVVRKATCPVFTLREPAMAPTA